MLIIFLFDGYQKNIKIRKYDDQKKQGNIT